VTIRADEVPAQINPVTTEVSSTSVIIKWTKPSTDNGSPITAYRVKIRQKTPNTTFTELVADCNGASPAIVAMALPQCTMLISALTTGPYLLEQGDLVAAVVNAYNIEGWGPVSTVNSVGALIEVIPKKMAAPTSGSTTLENQINVEWLALTGTNTGGKAITSYNLMWDKATNGVSWYNVVGDSPASLNLSATLSTTVIPGNSY